MAKFKIINEYGILADDRDTLLNYLRDTNVFLKEHKDIILSSTNKNLLEIKLSCGCKKIYLTEKEIPHKDDKCKHRKYFIKYV